MVAIVALTLWTLFGVQAPGTPTVVPEDQRRQAIAHYRTGQQLLLQEQFEQAIQEFTRAVQIDPLLTLAHYGLGKAHMSLKNYPAAIRAFIGCRDAYQSVYQLSGSVSLTREKLLDQELEELRDSIRTIQVSNLQVNSITIQKIEERIREVEHERRRGIMGNTFEIPAEVSLALGSAYFRNGNLDDAEREYKTAIDVNAKLGEAHNNLAVVYLLTNRAPLAVDEIKLAEKAGFRVNPGLKQQVKEAAGH